MTATGQKRLTLAAALVLLGLFVVANARLVTAALRSQPDCVAVEGPAPAKRAC